MSKSNERVFACPRCLSPITDYKGLCRQCGLEISASERDLLVAASSGIYYWGWGYGRLFYEEQLKHGHIASRYELTGLDILAYLASVVASGVIGNMAYDALKAICLPLIKQLRGDRSARVVIHIKEDDEQNFDDLVRLATEYVNYKSDPFAGSSKEYNEVFHCIEFNEPGNFLSLSTVDTLRAIYLKYRASEVPPKYVSQARNINYLYFVGAMKRSDSEDLTTFLVNKDFDKASLEMNRILKGFDLTRVVEFAGEDLTGAFGKWQRNFGIVLEIIENSILATQNAYMPTIAITVKGNTVTVTDNGFGMTCHDVISYYLVPNRTGWVSSAESDSTKNLMPQGIGVTGGLFWCEWMKLETKTALTASCAVELTIRNRRDILMTFLPSTNSRIQRSGTEVELELCLRRRDSWMEDPAYSILWDRDPQEIEDLLKREIVHYCAKVGDQTHIYLNGELINSTQNRGRASRTLHMKDFLQLKQVVVEVHLASTESTVATVELYRNGLFVCSDNIADLMRRVDVQITPSQHRRMRGFIIRCFLPRYVPLCIGKNGLPSHDHHLKRIVEKLAELIPH